MSLGMDTWFEKGQVRTAVLLFAVGAPVGGLVIVVGSTALNAFGPEGLAGNWAGRALLGLLGFAGYFLVMVTQLRYSSLLVFFGAFVALYWGIGSIAASVEDMALHQRGETTACAVSDVDQRIQTWHDSEGHTHTDKSYYYRLACADPRVQEMTTGSLVAEVGDRIEVIHDPAGRLTPRPAASIGDPRSSLTFGSVSLVTGIVLRLLCELDVPLLGAGSDGDSAASIRKTRRGCRATEA